MLSKANPTRTDMESVGKIMADCVPSLNFSRLLTLARMNEISPFLFRNLGGIKTVPADVVEALRKTYLAVVARNEVYIDATLETIALLKEKGIAAIPLKGALAADMIFRDTGLYFAQDIDILVKPSDLEAVKAILREHGFTCDDRLSEDLLASHYHLVFFGPQGQVLEVHWNLVKRYLSVFPDFWWEDARVVEFRGREVMILSPEKYLLYAIFRSFDHAFRPLKFIVFTAELADRYGNELDWQKLMAGARVCRMERLTLFTLEFLRDPIGKEIPHVSAGKKTYCYQVCKKVVLSGFFRPVVRVHLRMLLYLFLLDTPLDMMRALMRRLFPGKGEIRLRYGLPAGSQRIFFYYLANPFFLLFRRR